MNGPDAGGTLRRYRPRAQQVDGLLATDSPNSRPMAGVALGMYLEPVEGQLDLGSVTAAAPGGEIRCFVDTRAYPQALAHPPAMDQPACRSGSRLAIARKRVGLRNILWRAAGAGLAAVVCLRGVLDTPLQVWRLPR
jgi:hypothetical protein